MKKKKLYLDEKNNLLEEQTTTRQTVGIIEMDLKFYDIEHRKKFVEVISNMNSSDCYHLSVAYLISLDTVCRKHINQIYDFKEQCIIPESLSESWQTGTSKKTTRLAFNLWNNYCTDGEFYEDENGNKNPLPSIYFSPAEIFCSEYAPFYVEGIRLRFPEHFHNL